MFVCGGKQTKTLLGAFHQFGIDYSFFPVDLSTDFAGKFSARRIYKGILRFWVLKRKDFLQWFWVPYLLAREGQRLPPPPPESDPLRAQKSGRNTFSASSFAPETTRRKYFTIFCFKKQPHKSGRNGSPKSVCNWLIYVILLLDWEIFVSVVHR